MKDWRQTWLKFKGGDMDAFHRIYVAYFDKLYAYGSKLTNEHSVLEDSIQELFLQLYTRRSHLREDVNLEYYLLKSLKLTIYQRLRRKERIIPSGLANEDHESSLFKFKIENADEQTDKEGNDELLQALSGLDPKQRELLYLKFYNSLSYKEIGDILGINPDSAKKQVYRIIKKLKHNFRGFSIELFLYVVQHVKKS
ncbi:RNA polymerase sigma factor [Maribellus sediminis]|uniref:RNA polymerase sigma factor n=1 Tax=Maribellus sediminis TaxID=2696285 RepID=UPI00143018CA|nr:sigma-70 family RNA polymerase sigma factor [Maribellus sediminis]